MTLCLSDGRGPRAAAVKRGRVRYFVRPSRTKFPRPGGLRNEISFLTVWRLEIQDQGVSRGSSF